MPNWGDVLNEINEEKVKRSQQSKGAFDTVRRKYLRALFNHTGRNVIAYYSGWLSKPDVAGTEINDEDKNGFMMAVHKLDRQKGLDLILHTPGGSLAAAESLVDYLQAMFGSDIRAIVPQLAMSAGTMLACSCQEIWMAKHSNLGPIDPWLRGVPANGVLIEFKRAYEEIKKDPVKLHVWRPILEKYHPSFLGQCENAIRWSNAFVREQLATVMFAGEPDARKKAASIVRKLSGYSRNKAHDRHMHYEDCAGMGLKMRRIEDDDTFQDLVLTVHHCFMHSVTNTNAFKMIENHVGTAFVKQQTLVPVQIPQPQQM